MNTDGAIPLIPLADIPKREWLVWENAELRASLFCGLAEVAEGRGRPRPWITADLDEVE
ncbi:MAG TPA: hypothetical protein VG317_06745 [Pseudonocardiaceae bacterium]|nr:hypothetical protein [Pseudonocardiaceae bacterium]